MLHVWLTQFPFDPLTWVLALLIAALIAGKMHHQDFARAFTISAALLLFVLCFFPLGIWLARPLENRFPRPPLPAHVDGIVVLDSGIGPPIFASRGVVELRPTVMRIIAGVELARRYPDAKLIYSGITAATPRMQAWAQRGVAQEFAVLGMPAGRVRYENTSLDTGQNLVNTMRMVQPRPGETWMLVTSAVHMPRAIAIADRLGWKMTPWPSDYISPAGLPLLKIGYPADGLLEIDRALHEWLGIEVNRLSGRTR